MSYLHHTPLLIILKFSSGEGQGVGIVPEIRTYVEGVTVTEIENRKIEEGNY